MDHPLIGRTVDRRYEVTRLLREVQGGAVFAATDRMLGREVALRLVEPGDDEARRRFHRDSRIAARLRHPSVLEIRDVVTVDGAQGVVTELLAGESLGERVRARGALAVEEGVELLRQAAAGVAAGHRWGLVHGALAPGQLFLAEGEEGAPFRVQVLGLGLMAPRAEGAFAAPELRRGGAPTPTADVFSLGALGCFALAGVPPYPAEEVDTGVLVPLAFPPEWPAELGEALARALAAEPAARFRDAEELAAALGRVPAPAAPRRPGAAAKAWRAAALLLLAGAAGAAVYGAGAALRPRGEEPRDPPPSWTAERPPPPPAGEPADPPPAPRAERAEPERDGAHVYELSEVETLPRLLNGNEFAHALERTYPPAHRAARVGGRVVVRFLVDGEGRVEPGSIEVVQATSEAFGAATSRAVTVLRFTPARVDGRPVSVWVEQPVTWEVGS